MNISDMVTLRAAEGVGPYGQAAAFVHRGTIVPDGDCGPMGVYALRVHRPLRS